MRHDVLNRNSRAPARSRRTIHGVVYSCRSRGERAARTFEGERAMKRWSIGRIVLPVLVLAFAVSAGASAAGEAQKGRYKTDGATCVWDANDSGPNQCTPQTKGRFKKSGDTCVWDSDDNGADQCRPAKGRFKKDGSSCVWNGDDSGPDQCNPREPR
jgi:hypothetical protein